MRVTGTVGEFPATSAKGNPQSLTQLAATSVSKVEGCQAPTPVPATRVPTPEEAEALESMLLAPQGTWTITDNYQTNQYGTLTLTPGEAPLRSATDVVAPGQTARDYEAANAARAIALDDGTNTNLQKGAATEAAYAYLANGSPARVGYHVAFTKPVVLEPRHGSFVFQPTSMVAGHPDRSPVTITGERPSAPTVGGDTRVATFNVLNYFSDLGVDEAGCKGYPDRKGTFVTAKKCKVRGAFSREAFANQEAKIVSAINALDADVVALEEIENPVAVGVGTDRDASLARLVEALNKDAGGGTWAYVPSPEAVPEAEDVIRVAFIYKPATVAPVGPSLIHDDPAFTGLARQPLAQEFARVTTERSAPATFVVIANHFKSKGSGRLPGLLCCSILGQANPARGRLQLLFAGGSDQGTRGRGLGARLRSGRGLLRLRGTLRFARPRLCQRGREAAPSGRHQLGRQRPGVHRLRILEGRHERPPGRRS